jgi:hypothetical protein
VPGSVPLDASLEHPSQKPTRQIKQNGPIR